MQRFLATALLATTIFGAACPALAISDATAAQHNDPTAALTEVGIKLYLDADLCRTRKGLSGFYHSPSLSMVLCNNGSKEMTEENLDTLRHESVHVVQDCKNGIKGDRVLQRVLKPGVAQALAAQYGINLDRITEVYRGQGQDDHVVSLEHEAFTAAAGMSAATIASAVRIACSPR